MNLRESRTRFILVARYECVVAHGRVHWSLLQFLGRQTRVLPRCAAVILVKMHPILSTLLRVRTNWLLETRELFRSLRSRYAT